MKSSLYRWDTLMRELSQVLELTSNLRNKENCLNITTNGSLINSESFPYGGKEQNADCGELRGELKIKK